MRPVQRLQLLLVLNSAMDLINQSYHFSCGKSSILQKIKPAKEGKRGFYEKSNDVRIAPVIFLSGMFLETGRMKSEYSFQQSGAITGIDRSDMIDKDARFNRNEIWKTHRN